MRLFGQRDTKLNMEITLIIIGELTKGDFWSIKKSYENPNFKGCETKCITVNKILFEDSSEKYRTDRGDPFFLSPV